MVLVLVFLPLDSCFPPLRMVLFAVVLCARAWLWRAVVRPVPGRHAVRVDAVIMDSKNNWIAGVAVFADRVSSGLHAGR